MRVILESKVRSKPNLPIEAEAIIPRNFLKGTDLVVFEGNKERTLSETLLDLCRRHCSVARKHRGCFKR